MSGLVGKIVQDRYHFTEYIGRGGMAEVYKVWDSQRVIHLAAKVLHKDMALDKVFLRRFKREADTLTKLQHPHIIRSYGLQQEGRLAFLLMDFVEGESLKELIFDTDGPLPVEQIRNILRPVTGALHYAHSQGFVHCDIKPANIMLDKYGEVRVADFGIARVTDAATATMVGAGTPAYMAPEQVKGLDPTPQTDIYALGIVLFEMFTGGERPFTGETASMTGSTGEKIRREQLTVKPPSVRKFNPNISPVLDALIQKCLAKDPAERYQNPLEVMNDFERAVGGTAQTPIAKPALEQQPVSSPPLAPVQTARPLSSAQPKSVVQQPAPPLPSTQKKNFPVWGYVAGGVVLFAILLFGAFNLGGSRPAVPAPTATKKRPTRTPFPINTLSPTGTPKPHFLLTDYDDYNGDNAISIISQIDNWEELKTPGSNTWTLNFPAKTSAVLSSGWCAIDKETLLENIQEMEYSIIIDGYPINLDTYYDEPYEGEDSMWCQRFAFVLSGWNNGEHSYILQYTFSDDVNDGWDTYTRGVYVDEFLITVKKQTTVNLGEDVHSGNFTYSVVECRYRDQYYHSAYGYYYPTDEDAVFLDTVIRIENNNTQKPLSIAQDSFFAAYGSDNRSRSEADWFFAKYVKHGDVLNPNRFPYILDEVYDVEIGANQDAYVRAIFIVLPRESDVYVGIGNSALVDVTSCGN